MRRRRVGPDALTAREQEVLSLIQRGYTNRGIADALGISLAGAKYHVSEILSKLGVENREEAARWRPEVNRRWSMFSQLSALSSLREAFGVIGAHKIAAALVVPLAVIGLVGAGVGAVSLLDGGATQTPVRLAMPSVDPCKALFTYQCIKSEMQSFSTLEEATAGASFEPALPVYIPDGFEPVAIRHSRPEGTTEFIQSESFKQACPDCDTRMSHNDQIGVYYQNTRGEQLAILQGFPAYFSSYEATPDKDRGMLEISETEAIWVRGQPSGNAQQQITLSWDVGRFGTGWARLPDGTVLTGSPMSYSISSNGLSLEELVRIAESVSFD